MEVYVLPCTPIPIYKVELPDEDMDDQVAKLREIVGGHLELIPCPIAGVLLWANEEGKALRLPTNLRATVLAGLANDMLVGNVVVTGAKGPDIAPPPLDIEEHWGGMNGKATE